MSYLDKKDLFDKCQKDAGERCGIMIKRIQMRTATNLFLASGCFRFRILENFCIGSSISKLTKSTIPSEPFSPSVLTKKN